MAQMCGEHSEHPAIWHTIAKPNHITALIVVVQSCIGGFVFIISSLSSYDHYTVIMDYQIIMIKLNMCAYRDNIYQ